jgi:hypothetical protein
VKKILLSGMALALLALACGEEESITEPEPANTPGDVIITLEKAFNQRNVNYLKAAISEDFVFYFDPDDIGQNPPGSNYVIPEYWSYAEFRSYAQSLFERAFSVTISIPTGAIGEPDPEATTYKAENISIKLLVMIDRVNGYTCDQGYCDFEFGTYYNSTGTRLWRLVKWEDFTSVADDSYVSPAPASLGKILAMYK